MKAVARSLMVLGLISVLSMGVARSGGSATIWMAQAGEREELQGTEHPFPVGWVPATETGGAYVEEGATEAGALPGSVMPVEELRGTEFPFPVGFVPEGAE